MVRFFRAIQRIVKCRVQKIADYLIKIIPVYYKDLDKISLSRWFKVCFTDYSFLYKVKFTKRIPSFFNHVVMDMAFQTNFFDTSEIRKHADLAILYSIAARTNNKSMKFQADTKKKQMELKPKNENQITLNDFVDYIEITFNQVGQIDPEKISASRGFSLYHKAVERNKALEKQYNKSKCQL